MFMYMITFDQPLWLKATEIAVDTSLNVVLHLGGSHILMSFLGSVGTSSLKEFFLFNDQTNFWLGYGQTWSLNKC